MNGAPPRQPPLMVLPETFTDPRSGARPLRPRGHAAPPGSGPAAQTCGRCAHAVSVMGGAKSFTKCRLAEARWTNGPASDIRRKDLACRLWTKQSEDAADG
jgi:hypothetical protein